MSDMQRYDAPPIRELPKRTLAWYLQKFSRGRLLLLTYPIRPVPRYGHGRPPHAQLNDMFQDKRGEFSDRLGQLLAYKRELTAIPVDATAPNQLHWNNDWFVGLDIVALYGMLGLEKPARYLEIGSGNSTRIARRAVAEHGLSTQISSIDPNPRAECDEICDRVIRSPLEEIDLAVFDELESGDLLFVDSSHQVFMNSDVTIIFLEVLPRLHPGVVVHFHDIWLPYDYPTRWQNWYFSEQYLLANTLLSAPERYEVLLPNRFISEDSELSAVIEPLWRDPQMRGSHRHGGSFWIRT